MTCVAVLAAAMLAGLWAGAVDARAQLDSGTRHFTVHLDTATQDATGIDGDPGASGTSYIALDFDNNRACSTTYWSGIDSPVVMGHIHGGSYAMVENPAVTIEVMPIELLNGGNPNGVHWCAPVPSAELSAIARCPAQFNVTLHSEQHSVGAIRGQMGWSCDL